LCRVCVVGVEVLAPCSDASPVRRENAVTRDHATERNDRNAPSRNVMPRIAYCTAACLMLLVFTLSYSRLRQQTNAVQIQRPSVQPQTRPERVEALAGRDADTPIERKEGEAVARQAGSARAMPRLPTGRLSRREFPHSETRRPCHQRRRQDARPVPFRPFAR